MIVGESLFGVILSGLIVGTHREAPLALVSATFAPAKVLGVAAFVTLIVVLYRWMLRSGTRAST